MTKRTRIGVIGTGWWATYMHIPALLKNPDAELVAVADINPEKLSATAEHYQLEKAYSSYETMIEQETLDGVVIATYHSTHYEIACFCLEHGLHVMIEKPMVLYATHARDLVKLAQRKQREIVIGYTSNFTSSARRVHDLIYSGHIGNIEYVNCMFGSDVWKFLNSDVKQEGPVHGPGKVYNDPKLSGGGQGHLQATHSIGLMFFLTPLRAKRVLALMSNLGANVDVVDAMTVEFDNGALGNVGSYGHAGRGSRLDVTVYGDKGSVYFEAFTGKVLIHAHNGESEAIEPQDDHTKLHPSHKTSANLVDVILGNAENGSTGELGWRVVELLDAAYRSAALHGQSISIDDLYSEASS